MKYDLKLLGEIIRDVRTQAGYTAATFREKISNIDSSSYARIENCKDNFAPRADKLIEVVHTAANLEPIINHTFDFGSYINRPYGQETVSFFLSFRNIYNRYKEYAAETTNQNPTILSDNYIYLEQPIRNMLENHIVIENHKILLRNIVEKYKLKFCESYKGTESYQDALYDFPNGVRITRDFPKVDDAQFQDYDLDILFRNVLNKKSPETVLAFVEELIQFIQ